jgi:hypothetical protein
MIESYWTYYLPHKSSSMPHARISHSLVFVRSSPIDSMPLRNLETASGWYYGKFATRMCCLLNEMGGAGIAALQLHPSCFHLIRVKQHTQSVGGIQSKATSPQCLLKMP